jgi:hypothetical protein
MNTSALASFDYDVSPDLAAKLRAQAERIKERLRKDIIETGRDLLAVKDDPLVKHGLFIAWVESEVGITPARHNATWAPPGFAGKTTTCRFCPS